MKKFLVNHMWWITLILALIMLVAHTASFEFIKVDNISIILLVVILLSPFTTAITKIKFGDFEAEVSPEEVRKIKEQFEARAKDSEEPEKISEPELERTIENIQGLVESDPVLSLAKLRIELEKALNKLHQFAFNEKRQEKSLSAGQLIYKLDKAGILPSDISVSTREVIAICNRAIHGEDIRQQDVKSVIEVGVNLLREIVWQVKDYVLQPSKTEQINKATLEEFQDAKYQVTTVVPLVEKPYKTIRVLDQLGLDELLEGYSEYAEFIVDVRKINPRSKTKSKPT
jgi:hypothetical protein